MPDFEINFHLSNGGKATLKVENLNSSAPAIENSIQGLLRQPGDELHMSFSTAIVFLKKKEIVGYTIDVV